MATSRVRALALAVAVALLVVPAAGTAAAQQTQPLPGGLTFDPRCYLNPAMCDEDGVYRGPGGGNQVHVVTPPPSEPAAGTEQEFDPRCRVPGALCTGDGRLLQPAEEVTELPELPWFTGDPRVEEWDRQQMLAMSTMTSGTPESPVVAVDMKQVQFPDARPVLDAEIGRVRIPLRAVSEAMGADVKWDPAERKVTVSRDGLVVELWVDRYEARVNGAVLPLDAPPVIVPPGRVMVPLRFISEAFGATVDWVGDQPPPGYGRWRGRYQVWIWIPWGYWGTYGLADRTDGWVMYTREGRIDW